MTESDIQKEILSYLKTTNLLHWRQNSGVVFTGKRMIKLGVPGQPDIFLVLPGNGRLCGLEVKSATGKQNQHQLDYSALMITNGCRYGVVRNLEQAKEAIAYWLAERE